MSPTFLRRERIVLHVGLPKCGSSSIQAHMADNADAYRAAGVCYPRVHRLADGYRNHLPLARLRAAELAGALEDIRREAAGCHTIVLSCEHWTNALPGCNLPALCDAISQAMPRHEIRIVAYFRSPFDFVESCYAQFIRAGLMGVSRPEFYADGAPSIERFLHRFEETRGHPLWSVVGWAAAMRARTQGARTSLRSMEAGDLGASCVVTDFCGFLGLPKPDVAPRLNTRLSNRKLAELEHAQTLIDNDTHMAGREDMIAHDFGACRANDPQRCTSLHIGAHTARSIGLSLKRERDVIARLFDTRADALCAVPARDWRRDTLLSTEDKARIACYVADRQRGAA